MLAMTSSETPYEKKPELPHWTFGSPTTVAELALEAPEPYELPAPHAKFPNGGDIKFLFNAAQSGNVDDELLDVLRRCDETHVLVAGVSPLHIAAARGHLLFVETLCTHGYDANVEDAHTGYKPIDAAAYLGNTKMVDLLCNFGADPEEAVEIAVCMVSHASCARLLTPSPFTADLAYRCFNRCWPVFAAPAAS